MIKILLFCIKVKAVQGVSQVVVQVEEEFLDESHFYQDMDVSMLLYLHEYYKFLFITD